ncbi:hypothetical protein [Azonexus hydrophilus]|uniref:Glycine zipper 2TM domain-containing protein n=1 Tax=Azonexus hydrophilus TaxID=418702 RepID=A0ABZ2XQ76_9RHOO
MNLVIRAISVVLMAVFFSAALNTTVFAVEGDLSGSDYGANEARRYQRVQLGMVMAVREVVTNKDNPSARTTGAVIGGLLGVAATLLTGDREVKAAAMAVGGGVGAIAGGFIGNQVAGTERKRMVEVVIGLSDKSMISVVQELDADAASLKKGDVVRILDSSTGNTRVAKFEI